MVLITAFVEHHDFFIGTSRQIVELNLGRGFLNHEAYDTGG